MTILNKILLASMIAGLGLFSGRITNAQERTDSLIINVGKSKIIFLVRDKQDLETLKNYDLNEILRQLSLKLENDSTEQTLVSEQDGEKTYLSDTTIIVERSEVEVVKKREVQRDRSTEQDGDNNEGWRTRKVIKGTRHNFNIDIGTNNYVQDGKFPDETDEPYTVRPFGSWYVALNSTNQTHIAGPLYLEWGPSVSWYNFKFQNDKIRIIDGPEVTSFEEDVSVPDVDFKKSKLTVAYINFSVVPMFGFGEPPRREKKDFWDWKDWDDNDDHGFRIGVGGYGGYRIASYSKVVYEEGDDKEKDKDKDNFHLNNFRYGLRLQMGYRGTDLFFNYDLNELFAEGKGPQLNAFSFGLTF